MTDPIRTVEELDTLPNMAVVESHDNRVYQKLAARSGNLRWFQPGDMGGYVSGEIDLPARLLDDGL